MALVPSVTELLVAEMLYLQYDDATKPIYLYINSAGVIGGKQGSRLGYETEALSIYDTMEHVKPPVRTLCVGVAYGDAERGRDALGDAVTVDERRVVGGVWAKSGLLRRQSRDAF